MLAWRRWSADVQRIREMYEETRDALTGNPKEKTLKRNLEGFVFQSVAKRAFVASSPSPASHPLLLWRGKPKTTSRTLEDDDVVMRSTLPVSGLPHREIKVLDTKTVSVYENLKFEFWPPDYEKFFTDNDLTIEIARQFTLEFRNEVVGNDLRTALSAARRYVQNATEESKREGYVLVDVGDNEELCKKNGFKNFSEFLQETLNFFKLPWYTEEKNWAEHMMVRPLRKRGGVVNVLRGETVELCYDPPDQSNIPVFFYLADYARPSKIDRDLLLQGKAKLHLQADGENVLTLKKTEKRGENMLGVFAATDMPAGSVVSMYLGTAVTEKNEAEAKRSVYRVSLQKMWISGKTITTFAQPKKFFCRPDDAYSLAHFFNSSDYRDESGYDENKGAENCQITNEGIISLTRDVQAGDELLWCYGEDYYKK